MLLCDFHIHSNYSDGKLSVPEIVDFTANAVLTASASPTIWPTRGV